MIHAQDFKEKIKHIENDGLFISKIIITQT